LRVPLLALVLIGCQGDLVPVCDEENWDDLDAKHWTQINPGSGAVSVVDGQLQIALPMTQANEGVLGSETYDLQGGYVEIEIMQYLPASTQTEFELVVQRDATNYFFIGVENAELIVRLEQDDIDVEPTLERQILDPAVRFLRISHEGDVVAWETSIDHDTWQMRRTVPAPFALDELKVRLEADAYTALSDPGAVRLDNLVVAAPSCRDTDHELAPHQP
jgi:hypothetical protein